jgi:hypothetical protein
MSLTIHNVSLEFRAAAVATSENALMVPDKPFECHQLPDLLNDQQQCRYWLPTSSLGS